MNKLRYIAFGVLSSFVLSCDLPNLCTTEPCSDIVKSCEDQLSSSASRIMLLKKRHKEELEELNFRLIDLQLELDWCEILQQRK